MTQMTELTERIKRLLTQTLHLDIPSADTDLFDTGVLDSLAFVELLLRLEQEFGVAVTVDDLEVDTFRSVNRIAKFVWARTRRPPLRLVQCGA
jgi:D-alanine--poly(phosphoribitol) ligase subunit 2